MRSGSETAMGSATEHFDFSEIRCPCCGVCRVQKDALEALEALREAFEMPVTINSGYRCKAHNAKVGGSKRSQHMQGKAFDIKVPGVPPIAVGWVAHALGWRGISVHKTFTHIDMRSGAVWRKGFQV
jgi:uncharacterized protein YcbK (DUF882 family)